MRRLLTITGAVTVVLAGSAVRTAGAGAGPPPAYCATLSRIMADNPESPSEVDPSFFTTKAAELRSSKPPADVKKAVSDFASGLDALAGAMTSMKKNADLAAVRKQFGPDSKYQQGLGGVLGYLGTKCSGLTTPTTKTAVATSATASAIPDSPAIAAFASKMAGNPKAAPILQSCLVLTAMDLKLRLTKKTDPESAGRITQLATSVRAIDAKVGDAVSKAPLGVVATWCKHNGFAN